MKFDNNNIIIWIWALVGVVYTIYAISFIYCIHTKHIKDNIYNAIGINFSTFNCLGKSIAEGLTYFIEAFIIGVLLNFLNGINASIGSKTIDAIIKIAMQFIFPIISLKYLIELLNILKDNFSLETIDNDEYNFW